MEAYAELDEGRQPAADRDPARIRAVDAGHAAKQGALAAAVAPGDTEELTRGDVEADAVECLEQLGTLAPQRVEQAVAHRAEALARQLVGLAQLVHRDRSLSRSGEGIRGYDGGRAARHGAKTTGEYACRLRGGDLPQPLIVNLAPTGMVPTREHSPHVPLTTAEILDDVARCRELGVAIVHVHARDEHSRPTHRAEAFAPIVEGIRAIDPELVVCVTCSGRAVSDAELRAEVLELDGAARPDMASLTLGSNNFQRDASINEPSVIRELARRMLERGIRPELEAFEPGMVAFGARLAEEGLIPDRAYVNMLLGNLGTSPLSPASLAAFLAPLPPGWHWALAGIGRFQHQANLTAIAAGGHVRVGLEDNLWFDRGRTELATNAALVERVARAAEVAERPLASPAWVREQLGLGGGPRPKTVPERRHDQDQPRGTEQQGDRRKLYRVAP